MNETPSSSRTHIAFFGRRNAGKSSLVNAVTGQNIAIVSPVKGTTTDPVYKAMELLPLGPVVIIDTPGFDDDGDLGGLRVQKTRQVLRKTDIAVLVLDGEMHKADDELIKLIIERNIPVLIVLNKCDLLGQGTGDSGQDYCSQSNLDNNIQRFISAIPRPSSLIPYPLLQVSAKTGYNIDKLKNMIGSLAPKEPCRHLVKDLLNPLDVVILVIPIDKAAPKGRLILPQQQMIRDILEAGAVAVSVKESELESTLKKIKINPALVITDSQVFKEVSAIVPQEVPLTSFSILFARYKSFLDTAVKGAETLNNLKENDKLLIAEGCTHHRQCDDIGTVKLPRLIKNHAGFEPEFSFCSGGEFPQDLSSYKIIIHCGACMLNDREMHYRRQLAEKQGIAFTNYGIAIAHMNGILKRSTDIFLTQ